MKIILLIFLIHILSCSIIRAFAESTGDDNQDGEDIVALWMPRINTTKEDEYYCLGMEVDFDKRYIVKYVPHASQKSVHHILLYGCSEPIKSNPSTSHESGAWKCLDDHPIQSACSGRSSFLFAWAKDAPPFRLPEDVGFQIGLKTNVKGLFIQVHYSVAVTNDNSGLSLVMTDRARKYAAGIMILAGGGQIIPPRQPAVNVNVMCTLKTDTVLHPFGFRTHAHVLGTVISGWYMSLEDQQSQTWTLLGKQSPQNPQSFYPMKSAHNLTDGMILGARCVYNSTDRSGITMMGPTHKDEMCNFYMMYYAEHRITKESCADVEPSLMNLQLPVEASEPLPSSEVHHHHSGMVMTETTPTGFVISVGGQVSDTTMPSKQRKPGAEITMGYPDYKGREGEIEKTNAPMVVKRPNISPQDNLNKQYEYEEVEQWSAKVTAMKLGQISGVARHPSSPDVYIFHRNSHSWDSDSFGVDDRYARIQDGPIKEPTILVVDGESAAIKSRFGSDIFYMPHGITVDNSGNVWTTDVALHQVIKMTGEKISMILGKQFEPGHDGAHFCKPTSVAVTENGDFYVGDGYCNSRILKFNPDGVFLQIIGKEKFDIFEALSIAPAPEQFYIPHDIKLSADEKSLFVADRENGRIQSFATENAAFQKLYKVPEFGFKVFSLDVAGDLMAVVNGLANIPAEHETVQVILVNITTQKTISVINSKKSPLVNPHSVAVSHDQHCIYVVELDGRIHQFHSTYVPQLALPASKETKQQLNTKSAGEIGHGGSPFNQLESSGYVIMIAIFCVPTLILFCGITICCLRKNQQSQTKWKDMLYRYKPNIDAEFGAFINKKQGFRPLRQEEGMDDDSDSDEEVFSSQKSQHRVTA